MAIEASSVPLLVGLVIGNERLNERGIFTPKLSNRFSVCVRRPVQFGHMPGLNAMFGCYPVMGGVFIYSRPSTCCHLIISFNQKNSFLCPSAHIICFHQLKVSRWDVCKSTAVQGKIDSLGRVFRYINSVYPLSV